MPISRINTYTPGETARGDHVQAEYDSIISFVNGLEASKLAITGGTVSSLTVAGSFVAQGSSIFNAGFTVNNNTGDFTAGIAVTAGPVTMAGSGDFTVTKNLNLNGTLDFPLGHAITGLSSVTGFGGSGVQFAGVVAPTYSSAPSGGNDLTNKTYVDAQIGASNDVSTDEIAIFTYTAGGTGSGILTMDAVSVGGVNKLRLNVSGIPTATTGLVTGDIYSNSGVLTVV